MKRWNVPFNSTVVSLNGTFHLSPDENILTIALINIHYLYIGLNVVNNKPSLVPRISENFDVLREDPSSGVTRGGLHERLY